MNITFESVSLSLYLLWNDTNIVIHVEKFISPQLNGLRLAKHDRYTFGIYFEWELFTCNKNIYLRTCNQGILLFILFLFRTPQPYILKDLTIQ